jgi:cysteine synthase A|tara:strand:+ start:891 stop:1736 length:846 start_codon:yes stop_codon:yes gene_type:complete
LREIVGRTPLVKISDKLWAKLETYNPSGSVKDRMITWIVSEAAESGQITQDTVLCDATSGNTGIALSLMAATLDLPCYIFMPKNMSEERKQMMRVFGAVVIDAPDDDFEAAIQMRDKFLADNLNAWSPMQFSNPLNVVCHEKTTGPEVLNGALLIGKKLEAFVHGAGTGGTIEGVRRYLRKQHRDTKVLMVKPSESPHGIQGIADGKDFLAKPEDMDGVIEVQTEAAINRAKRLARENGLLVGISSGANVLAAEKWIEENDPEGIVITMLCDRGERYMSIY